MVVPSSFYFTSGDPSKSLSTLPETNENTTGYVIWKQSSSPKTATIPCSLSSRSNETIKWQTGSGISSHGHAMANAALKAQAKRSTCCTVLDLHTEWNQLFKLRCLFGDPRLRQTTWVPIQRYATRDHWDLWQYCFQKTMVCHHIYPSSHNHGSGKWPPKDDWIFSHLPGPHFPRNHDYGRKGNFNFQPIEHQLPTPLLRSQGPSTGETQQVCDVPEDIKPVQLSINKLFSVQGTCAVVSKSALKLCNFARFQTKIKTYKHHNHVLFHNVIYITS